jgi:hypothetical protein
MRTRRPRIAFALRPLLLVCISFGVVGVVRAQAPSQDEPDQEAGVFGLLQRNDKAAIPALEAAFVKQKETLTRLMIAAALVKLGDGDKAYWEYLVAAASAALSNTMPFPVVYDEKGESVRGKYNDEFLAWCERSKVSPDSAAATAMIELPVPILTLAASHDARGYDLFARGLTSNNHLIVIASAQGLARLQDKRAIPLLIEAGRRVPAEVALGVAQALVFFDEPQAQAAVEAFIPDKEYLTALRKQVQEHGSNGMLP